jgi:hypothetical protein
LSSIFSEYLLFSDPKSRLEDQRFIERFELIEEELTEEGNSTLSTSTPESSDELKVTPDKNTNEA